MSPFSGETMPNRSITLRILCAMAGLCVAAGAMDADPTATVVEFYNTTLRHYFMTAGPAEAAFFSLHGAMQAEGEDDPEGYLLQEARRILGEKMPFVVTLDLHGILTDRMLRHSDAVVAYHTYPHVDFFQTGARGASLPSS